MIVVLVLVGVVVIVFGSGTRIYLHADMPMLFFCIGGPSVVLASLDIELNSSRADGQPLHLARFS